MTQSKRYAVTGGIGSGKTAVCEILKKMGFPVFSCDGISRELWQDAAYRRELAALFPGCSENGEAIKEKVVSLVFSDGGALDALESFSHPRIMEKLLRKTSACAVSFSEVPLLFEGGYERFFDGVIAVRRDRNARKEAVRQRDGADEGETEKRMARQLDPALLDTKDCLIVENDGDLDSLEKKVKAALGKFGL